MKSFEQYITEKEILTQICKIRVKIAKSRSKKHLLHLLTSNSKYNYHVQLDRPPENEFERHQVELSRFLSTILPPRKKWVKLGENSRRKRNLSQETLTSSDRNFYSLLKTIRVHEKRESQEQWFLNLQVFISEIKQSFTSKSYQVEPPIIFPKLKGELNKWDINECRPICIFNLKDRIILSITNKFLTRILDNHFQDSSYAFRIKKNRENRTLSHHDCIKDILHYRYENRNKQLFVVECDMMKFYDSVNHTITKDLFNELISIVTQQNPDLKLDSAVRIFESYLSCFAFNINIPKPSDTKYWLSYKIPKGEFSWINEFLNCHYEDISNERIGVPQGGALSGLIANIYLNQVDIKMSKTNVFYQRFCDDMIIITDDLNECIRSKEIYMNALLDLKLFPHRFKDDSELLKILKGKINYKPFWKGKSKGPYRWGEIEKNSFPWIGFVGYEINYLGDIRVRKRSLEKELKKQKTIINEIKNAIKKGMRKPKGTATESAINRLIGMSVGRIKLYNFDVASADLSWKNGFRELTMNKHSIRQIKQLDRNRSKLYYNFLKNIKGPKSKIYVEKRQVIKYNKPFSYYYQILERQNEKEE